MLQRRKPGVVWTAIALLVAIPLSLWAVVTIALVVAAALGFHPDLMTSLLVDIKSLGAPLASALAAVLAVPGIEKLIGAVVRSRKKKRLNAARSAGAKEVAGWMPKPKPRATPPEEPDGGDEAVS